jgi:hypothetical protein
VKGALNLHYVVAVVWNVFVSNLETTKFLVLFPYKVVAIAKYNHLCCLHFHLRVFSQKDCKKMCLLPGHVCLYVPL